MNGYFHLEWKVDWVINNVPVSDPISPPCRSDTELSPCRAPEIFGLNPHFQNK